MTRVRCGLQPHDRSAGRVLDSERPKRPLPMPEKTTVVCSDSHDNFEEAMGRKRDQFGVKLKGVWGIGLDQKESPDAPA